MKKVLRILSIALSCTLFLFVAAGCGDGGYSKFAQSYDTVRSASQIVKTISVNGGGSLITSVEEVYTKSGEGYELVKTSTQRNPIGSETEFTVIESEKQNVSADSLSFGKLPDYSEFFSKSFDYDGEKTIFRATIGRSSLHAISINNKDDVDGLAVFYAVADGGKFTEMQIMYISKNGNDISITFEYIY